MITNESYILCLLIISIRSDPELDLLSSSCPFFFLSFSLTKSIDFYFYNKNFSFYECRLFTSIPPCTQVHLLSILFLAGLKESTQVNQKDTSVKRTKDSIHYHSQSKEVSRDTNKSYSSCNRNMSPPLTNYQSNTTTSSTTTSSSPSSISMSNQSGQHQAHYNSQQIPYGSTPLHHQMYPSGSVPLIHQYQMHPSFMNTVLPGQPMMAPPYGQHGERNDLSSRDGNIGMQVQNEHQPNSTSQHPMNSNRGSRRGGRSRGGNNNMNRRDYQMRQNNQHQQQQNQQSSLTSNEYGQPLMEQGQPGTAVMGSGPYQQFYIHYPYYGGPNAGAHLALPGSANAANAQNLTGQPLFAIQQPLLYQYGSPYPIMYNMMPTQAHQMAHQQPDDGDNQNQDTSGNPPTVIQQIPWPHHVAYQEPQQIFQHSPHLNTSEVDLEFQVQPTDEYHLQMMNHSSNYHLIAPDQHPVMVDDIVQTDQSIQDDGFTDGAPIENEPIDEHRMYQQDLNVAESNSDMRLLMEKTRDLMIQTSPQDAPPAHHLMQAPQEEVVITPNAQREAILSPVSHSVGVSKKSVETETVEIANINSKVVTTVDNKMIVKNKEKPPAWGAHVVPNLAAQPAMKKPTAVSVSVSAIPNKDVLHLQATNSSANDLAADQTMREVVSPFSNTNEFKAASGKDHSSFSSITSSKQPLSPTIADSKKTEHKQNEMQPLQKQQQIALSERAKQQIVTTITGVGASSQDSVKKSESTPSRSNQNQQYEELSVAVEKSVQPVKTAAPANVAAPSSWAGLFVSSSERISVSRPQQHSLPSPSPPQNQIPETQKVTTAKNPEPLPVQTSPQVPGVMSYSAVSAQSLPPAMTVNYAASVSSVPSQLPTGSASLTKKLPQSKQNLTNSNNNNVENHLKSEPVDHHSLKLGGL